MYKTPFGKSGHILWESLHSHCLSLPTHRFYPHATKHEVIRSTGHNETPAEKTLRFLTNGLVTATRAICTAGQQKLQPFVKPSTPPQSQFQNTPFYYSQHTWQFPTSPTALSRSTFLSSCTCMCQQDYCIAQNFDGGKVWRNLTNACWIVKVFPTKILHLENLSIAYFTVIIY